MRIFFILSLSFLSSCMPYKFRTEEIPPRLALETKAQKDLYDDAVKHWLYKFIPKKRGQIRLVDLGHWLSWGLLGNDDDGIFGEELSSRYKSSRDADFIRALQWGARNPLHNFGFYVIGSARAKNSQYVVLKLAPKTFEFLEYKDDAKVVFASKHSSFLFAINGWKPFISWRLYYGRNFDFYLGWRQRGNFGVKFLPFSKAKDR